MSVLFKDMDMPTGCLSCDFCNPFVDEPYCRRLMKQAPKATRLEDCPLDPTADVRENIRGEWERVDGFTGVEAFGFKETTVEGWSCSICDFEIDVSEKSFNFCPNCGADMRGEENNEI